MSQVNLILIGPPGSGKGTQAARIVQHYTVPLISTGDIFRAAVKAKSPLGLQVKAIMAAGALVGDDLVIDLVRERLRQPDTGRGFILDGFPRTIGQARALDETLGDRPLLAIVLRVPEDELIRRLSSRRICSTCKTLFTSRSVYGSEAEVCSKCGSILITRDDDNVETVKNRLATFRATSDPLIAHYQDRDEMTAIDGTAPPDAVSRAILQAIDARFS
jgi:adenylate kinase